MKSALAVVGAGWGDEAKGLLTAHLARTEQNVLVVRHNGGAQAGHTVVREDGFRHVFSHIGAGTLEGVPTYLARTFTANPLLLQREMQELMIGLDRTPLVFVDPEMPVSIPHDMMLNAVAEQVRGSRRHGSVGVGYGEAVAREEAGFGLPYDILRSERNARDFMNRIEKEWVPVRLEQLEATAPGIVQAWNGVPEGLREAWMDSLPQMFSLFHAVLPVDVMDFETLVFEGAQGLRLDMELGDFPHVTRSLTGLPNVVSFLNRAGIENPVIHPIYATRCYATRHGAGPLERETDGPPVPLFRDDTNKPHPYQGSLRFAPLDVDAMQDYVLKDIGRAKDAGATIAHPSLHISCMDQAGDAEIPYWSGMAMRQAKAEDFPEILDARFLNVRSTGWGERVSDVRLENFGSVSV